jgi:hypothetical protein
MSIALEITLILVLISVTVGLVALLFQLRKTAQGLDLFLLSTKQDLAQISADVHASRLRMDLLAGSLAVSLGEISVFAKSVGEVGNTVAELHARFRNTIDSATRNLGGIIGGISAVLAFCKSRPTSHESEKDHEHERT